MSNSRTTNRKLRTNKHIRLILSPIIFPFAKQVHVGDSFRVDAIIKTKNVNYVILVISFESEFLQLVNSPQKIELIPTASYKSEVGWLIRALKPTDNTTVSVRAEADSLSQVAEFSFCIKSSDSHSRIGDVNEVL
jgi:hypothetical protein